MNAIDDKLYARTEKFVNNMNNLLLRIKGEATKIARKQVEPKTSAGEVIGYLAIGITIGAAASLLLAPSSGKETREKLSSNFKDVSKKVTDWQKKEGERLENMSKGNKEGEKSIKPTNA